MKKRVLSFVLAAVLGGLGCMPISDVQAEENGAEPETVSRGTLLYETDMVTRKDFEEGFLNYAQSDMSMTFCAIFICA